MLGKTVSCAILVLLLLNALVLAFNARPVKAEPRTVYIRADGSIDPSAAPVSTLDNVTYSFTGEIYDSIVVERDNIVVDGSGYAVQGASAYDSRGIDMSGRTNVTVKNTQITSFTYGIFLGPFSSNNRISGNNITANLDDGISLSSYSNSNSIIGNNITANYLHGIYTDSSSSHNSIIGNNITANNGDGIFLRSSFNSISWNNITANNSHGILLVSSSNNVISGNTFTDCGLSVSDSYENSVENNTLNGKPLVYLEGVTDYSVLDAGQVILVRCDGIRVESLNLSRAGVGVQLWQTNDSIISGNSVTASILYGVWLDSFSSHNSISGNNVTLSIGYAVYIDSSSNNVVSGNNVTLSIGYGVYLNSSSGNIVSGNNISANNGYGVGLESSSNISLCGNNIAENHDGIDLRYSPNNSISWNNITANGYSGVWLYSSSNNTVSGNNVTNNRCGMSLYSSSDNSICHNNFVNNTQQVATIASTNVWDQGYPSGGNYWSDYNGTDADHDGIGDIPYVIDTNNTDNYPLMGMPPEGVSESPWWTSPLVIGVIAAVAAVAVAVSFVTFRRKKPETERAGSPPPPPSNKKT